MMKNPCSFVYRRSNQDWRTAQEV